MRNFLPPVLIALMSVWTFAQSTTLFKSGFELDKFSAPIAWQRYKITHQKVSALFPKLPVVLDKSECEGAVVTLYDAYADQTVYELRTVMKDPAESRTGCYRLRDFDYQSLARRLQELRKTGPTSESESSMGFRRMRVFKWDVQNEIAYRWIIPDRSTGGWFELALNHRKTVKPDVDGFLKSFEFGDEGIEIGVGAERNLGDEGFRQKPLPESTDKSQIINASLVTKPRSNFTNEARKMNIKGSVELRITLLSNGGVGDIEVISGLAGGLTEEVVQGVKKLMFLPKTVDGSPVTTTVRWSASFNIM
jgi:TonB family protein